MIDLVCVEKWFVNCHVSTLCCKKGRPDVCKSLFSADLNSANLGLVRFYQTALCKSFFRTNASQDLNSAVLKYFLDTFPHYSRTYYICLPTLKPPVPKMLHFAVCSTQNLSRMSWAFSHQWISWKTKKKQFVSRKKGTSSFPSESEDF